MLGVKSSVFKYRLTKNGFSDPKTFQYSFEITSLFYCYFLKELFKLTLTFIEQRGKLGSSGISHVVDVVVISSAEKKNDN